MSLCLSFSPSIIACKFKYYPTHEFEWPNYVALGWHELALVFVISSYVPSRILFSQLLHLMHDHKVSGVQIKLRQHF